MREAIESVLAQSYEDWEILLVDDGSAGESTGQAQQYARQYPGKVRYLDHRGHRNRGLSASRNLGIEQARGQYIALLDADDVWFPHKLEQQVAILESCPEAAMLYGNTEYWYSWTGNAEERRDFVPRLGLKPNTLIDPPTLLPSFLRGDAAVPCTCSLLVRREVFDDIGGFEAAFPNMYEDQVFYSKVCLAAPVFVADTCWDRYRQRPESICAVAEKTGQAHTARLIYLRWLEQYVSAQQNEDPEVWKALRAELRRCNSARGWDVLEPLEYIKRRVRKVLLRMRSY